MSTEVKVPPVGESITSGVLSAWHKKEGDFVQIDEILFTLETDKVSTEVNAPESGVLHISIPEGEEVKIGQAVGSITAGSASPSAATSPTTPEPSSSLENTTKKSAPAVSSASRSSESIPSAPSLPPVAPKTLSPPQSPKGDTLQEAYTTRKKLSPLRRKIAKQLVSAQHTAAILTTFNECDMSTVMALRKSMQEDFTKMYGVKLGFMSFFVKACVNALQSVPSLNSRLDGEELVQNHYYDLGVAVGTERGLVVPVVRKCDTLSFAEIEQALIGYAQKAREGKISLEDLQGGVFTISNGGVYGSLMSTPILNPPQSGILGMHKIQERPIAIKGNVVIRPMMYLALSYDHRVVDGKEAVTFLIRVKECIENPMRLLLGA